MRAIRRIMVVLLLAALAAAPARAQTPTWYSFTWQPGVPLSNTKEFTNEFAWRGVGFDVKRAVKPNVAVGLSFGWQVFTQQTDQVVSAFGLDISGDQFRYINSFPILANVSYFFGKEGGARPYVTANVGTYVMEHQLDIGLYSIHETNWHFGFAPEAGIAFPLRPNLAGVLNGRYNYALSAGSTDDQSYVTFGVGLAWTHGY
jgi:opacity protein-like surface antigen